MSEVIKKESLDGARYWILAPGVSSEALTVKADKEESKLFFKAENLAVDKDLTEEASLDIECFIEVDTRYDVAESKVEVENGVISITVATQKDRIATIHPQGE